MSYGQNFVYGQDFLLTLIAYGKLIDSVSSYYFYYLNRTQANKFKQS